MKINIPATTKAATAMIFSNPANLFNDLTFMKGSKAPNTNKINATINKIHAINDSGDGLVN